jgi:hypothetical protein
MSPSANYTKEEVIKLLQSFYKDFGRPPRRNEPNFKKIEYAAIRDFGSWRRALQVAGLQTYEQWHRKKSFNNKIVSLLRGNPLTHEEIKKEIQKDESSAGKYFSQILQSSSVIKSIGPRRKKIYFLQGEESIAENKLNEVLSNVPEDEEILYQLLVKPMCKKEILEYFNGSERRCETLLSELLLAELVYKVDFVAHSHGSLRFNASDFFGNLAGKRYYCRLDSPKEMCDFIMENIPAKNSDEANFDTCLLRKLNVILPDSVYGKFLVSFPFNKSKPNKKNGLDYFIS